MHKDANSLWLGNIIFTNTGSVSTSQSRFGELKMDYRSPAGYDRTRNAVIGHKDFDLTYLEEAYTSEHWLVRIYRVKKPDEFNR